MQITKMQVENISNEFKSFLILGCRSTKDDLTKISSNKLFPHLQYSGFFVYSDVQSLHLNLFVIF